jgi:hypothetical protein
MKLNIKKWALTPHAVERIEERKNFFKGTRKHS